MLSLLAWQTPAVFCKQNRDVCVRQQVDQFVTQSMAITLSLSHIHMYIYSCKHSLYNAVALQVVLGDLLIYVASASFFFSSRKSFDLLTALVSVDLNTTMHQTEFYLTLASSHSNHMSSAGICITLLDLSKHSWVCVCLWLCSRSTEESLPGC